MVFRTPFWATLLAAPVATIFSGVRVRLVGLAVVLCVLSPVEPAGATYPGANGRIVYASGHQLWSVQPDGTDRKLLTTVASPSGAEPYYVLNPSFSADGSTIAVALREHKRLPSCRGPALSAESGFCGWLIVMNADGSDQRAVFGSPDMVGTAALSPDGRRIAFYMVAKGFSVPLYVIDINRKRPKRLTRLRGKVPATDAGPAWSPDGSRIAFYSDRDFIERVRSWSLYTVGLRKRDISPVIPNGMTNDLEPDWAPNGERLAFVRTTLSHYSIYTVNRDGTAERELVRDNANGPFIPKWSPDGTQLAYLNRGAIWGVNADGSNRRVLISTHVNGFDWQPLPVGDAPPARR